ncbi:TonB-dependent receptor [Sphingomonas naphthae]|uniref:TonB-dependent receptor n=1 Tax=Sphingomonas naphthae TaxID=1813468 RepID=A0ABY7TN29_9SPHN|nr:TonB-dependent receptor [Sphingomonas naphthae]WCT74340.1 TonB-dependent receptor [Sphingomonas naphthae]
MRARGFAWALAVVAGPVWAAERVAIDLPAGRLGDAVAALSRQAGVSVAGDGTLWSRPVRAVKGWMAPREALDRLLAGSGARAVALGGRNWRIVAARPVVVAVKRLAPPPAVETGGDIVVTASKRDVRLRDFAGSVSQLDGPDLAFGGEQGTGSILARLASLSSTHLGAGRNKLFIRGIADSSFTGPTQATVGQYLGDMRLTYNAPDPDLRLYDIKAVEVLEGPQGTLYGAGSLGGIVRIVPNSPDLTATGGAMSVGASATQHGDPGGDLGGMVNVPLVEGSVGLRVVGFAMREGGYIDDVVRRRRDVNRTSVSGGRATLRFDPGDGWSIDLGGVMQDNAGRDSQYADRDQPPLTRASPTDGGFDAEYRLGQIVIGKAWDGLRFLSSTGLVRQRLEERYDATPLGGSNQLFVQRNRTAMFASENRLWRPMRGGFGWVVGASYTRNRTRLIRYLGPEAAPLPVTGVTNRIAETTLYGEASVEPIRGLTVTGGLRYARQRLSGEGEDVLPAFRALLIEQGTVASRRETSLLPFASVSGAVLPGVLLYARYQEGFRPGGLAIESGIVRRFRNDRVRTMETGLRVGQRGRDPVDLAVALSYTRWGDIQADFIDTSGLPSTDNIGDGRIYTISAALGWQPVPRLQLDAALSLNDSKVTDPSPTFAATLAGLFTPGRPIGAGVTGSGEAASMISRAMGRIPNVARFTTRIGADYRLPVGDDLEFRVSGWARYVGKSRLGLGPLLGEAQGDYLDTALTARIGRAGLGLTIGITNLTDAIGNRFALGTPFAANDGRQITPLRPRTIRVGLDTAF